MSFRTYSRKTGKTCNQNIFTASWPGIMWMKQNLLNFDSDALNCDPVLFPAKNSPNSVKSNYIFSGQRTRDRALILPWSLFTSIIINLDFSQLQKEKGDQSWTKSGNFGFVPSPQKLESFKKVSTNIFAR